MPFGQTPVTTTQGGLTTNQFPLSSVAPPNNANGDLVALEGGPVSTDSNTNKTSPASMYIKDGNDVTKGTQADAAWSGSGAATEIAILKKLVALLTAALTVSGTVTANAGTNMSTAALALETGGNLASAKSDLDAIVTSNSAVNSAVGAQADAAWSGSGSGSEIAILKKIVAELAATLTVSGSVSVSNFPGTQPVSGTFWQATQPVSSASLPLPTGAAIESGHLATIDSHIPALGQVAMIGSSPVVIASDQSKLPTKAASGDFVAGSITDIATLLTLSGTPTDANTINSLMGRLTKIRDLLAATLTVSGAVTTSGTVTEANSASIKTDLDTVVTNTNKIPASPAQEGGNLATLVTNTGRIPAQGQAIMANSAPVTIASNQSGFGTLALPTITEDTMRNATRVGNAFYASTEQLSPVNANTAYSLFNPVASGKTLMLHSINLQYSTGQQFARMRVVNTNPSFAVTLSPANFNLGNALTGSANASVASVTYATATTTAPALSAASLAYGVMTNLTNVTNELLTNSRAIALSAGTGFVVYFSNTAAGTLIVSFYWLEV